MAGLPDGVSVAGRGKKTSGSKLKCRAVSPGGGAADSGTVTGELMISCGSGAIELLTIVPIGRKPMDMRSFANGYGLKSGWIAISQSPDVRR